MNKEELLFSQFDGKYTKISNEYFIEEDMALKFIDFILKNDIKILGIDGFNINKHGVYPNIKVISDYSKASMTESIEISIIFISENKHLVSHFNFVLDI